MHTGDTIAALATAPGHAPRALLRLSGPGARTILAPALRFDDEPKPRTIARAVLHLPAPLPVLVASFAAPHSYTGEDTLEILFPGSPALAERVLACCLAHGARLAEPGEFTARAYLNDRLCLDEAEGVQAIIAAETDAQLQAARALLDGSTGDRWRAHADTLADALALVEAGIDFTDQEDVVAITPPDLRARLTRVRASIDRELEAAAGAEPEPAEPSVVLVGPPNAGKSTLFNALRRAAAAPTHAPGLLAPRVVESAEPGSTRDAIAERLDLSRLVPGAPPVRWTDLPGLDAEPRTPAGVAAQRNARDAITRAALIVHCDPAARFEPIPSAPRATPVLRVRTKADQLRPEPDAPEPLAVCAFDGHGLPALARAIADAATRRPGATITPRARRALADTRDALDAALRVAHPHADRLDEPELIAGALRDALDRLAELVGRITPDDVLGRVFASFCVGK
ncbi:MAG: tRNA uridine-5-carboxymethylaminomethyl(34) synthesis GTPase MnmE [Phycisphaerales bacterium]|nr:MAG: tRNA uridine-5-carboxymethylaminomethyl(34) synthesis GTPase MnmE [Phycisphaerales bacterium]